MYKQYKLVFILALLVIGIFFILLWASDQYNQRLDEENYKNFLQGNSGYTPIKNGMPWNMNVVYNDIHKLAEKNNMILIGSSISREGVLPDQMYLPDNWTFHNFAMSADTVYSIKVMMNYLNNYSNHRPDKNDVLIIDISLSTFIENSPENDYTKSSIERTGTFTVDDKGEITGQEIFPSYNTLAVKPYAIYSTLYSIISDCGRPIKSKSEELINQFVTRKNVDKYEKYRVYWEIRTINTTYPNNSTDEFKELIGQLKNQTNIVVENMYVPTWIRNSPKGKEYENWVQTDLVPFLMEENVTWIDYASSVPDTEYRDHAHLFRNGRIRFTKIFNEEINTILIGSNIGD